jgi:pimeloyl-ACP methyl ester carboxylesterase
MTEISHRFLETNGIRTFIGEAGSGPLVLLLHGFPESWYSYRHQLLALAAAGYHAVAPDQRGYGETDAPDAIEAYDAVELAADAAGLIAALGEKSAIVVGHDWGAPVAWHTALLHPDKVRAVVGLSIPWGGRPTSSHLQTMKKLFTERFFYMLYFQKPGVAEAELEADVRKSLRIMFYSWSGDAPLGAAAPNKPRTAKLLDLMPDPAELPAWFSQADLDYYTSRFELSGFRGPLNWYRNFDRTWERTASLAEARIEQPALFVAGDRDPAVIMSSRALERMAKHVPGLRGDLRIEGVGHWTQQERPEALSRILLDFVAQVA